MQTVPLPNPSAAQASRPSVARQNEVNTLDNAARAAVVDSFRTRSLGNQTEYMQGVKRVDFLGRKNLFAGLTRARDGQDRWDIHFVASA
ncbi:hypothetical protein SERLA73DRAFT_175913 [Serpula lacrymans var. lacrymans S7.3]|uniref:DUF6699 domain-containing protein n=2 Tax=Serpula lacrymans var. lacrymans TaxID=341189 RepID=F8PJJ3_SERL3|nr:uncharacterized protein SERLADRAFT_458564 [Serpula lacrymans var. lacrymans S7.9]EGO04131.1 hypothetical protein SERLA73DRAFT_175913 [Serpula lacrymans var. lacrymans S7.3]EGO30063.1 hypothetical protein SERLADRAFT_458564 [Serpula lacrymans var. lacrymans S7.9]